ncbi:hypothetical protein MMC12_000277 [Toensbergia leucococca]|nr:hypothetical protein [Toensbergia leucococca]
METAQYYPLNDANPYINIANQAPPELFAWYAPETHNVSTESLTRHTLHNQNESHFQLPVDEVEELDTSSRPRLTQEQINILEEQFKDESKPGTEFKRRLAARIGLSLQRVNVCGKWDTRSLIEADNVPQNWYQNRRAKARHQKPQGERLEVLPVDSSPASWDTLGFSAQSYSHPLHYQPAILASTDEQVVQAADKYTASTQGAQHLVTPKYHYLDAADLATGEEMARRWAAHRNFTNETNLACHSKDNNDEDRRMPTSVDLEWGISSDSPSAWMPPVERESPLQNDQFTLMQESVSLFDQQGHISQQLRDADIFAPQHPVESFHVEPNFGQTSASIWSSSHDSQTETSPVVSPPITQPLDGAFPRRSSGSSDLAFDFGAVHLQREQSQQELYQSVLNTPAANIVDVPVQMATEVRSLSTGSMVGDTLAAPRIDIASRRKRPRPAALGSGTQRSHSYAGALTMSPTPKLSSLSPASSVRRIRSTGNNLNVVSGRVQKSGTGSAQRSPLNLQTFEEAGAYSNANVLTRHNLDAAQLSAAPLTPLSPLGMKHHLGNSTSPFSEQDAVPSWTPGRDYSTSASFEARPDITSPPITPLTTNMFSYMHQFSLPHAVPHSAPPQQTTFPNHSPHFPEASYWQAPYNTAPRETYHNLAQHPMHQSYQSIPFNCGESFGVFPTQSHPYMHHSPPMGPYRPSYANQSPPPKEMEIHITTFPEPPQQVPKEPHQPKKYVFQHTTPDDF